MRKAIGRTDKGKVRENNQDQYAIIREDDAIFAIVCDGIGGHAGGKRASNFITRYVKKHFVDHVPFLNAKDAIATIYQLLKDANSELLEVANKNVELQGMGTTLVGLYVTNDYKILINVGDSRCYGFNDETLDLLSDDHSYVNELVKLGKISKDQAEVHPYRNMLTNAFGISETLFADIKEIERSYANYMLCSDGLHGYVQEDEIFNELRSSKSMTHKIKTLIEKANSVGGFDNVTIVLISDGGVTYE